MSKSIATTKSTRSSKKSTAKKSPASKPPGESSPLTIEIRPTPINEVHLIGRISSEPKARALPSGDEVVEFRLVVGRAPKSNSSNGSDQQIDTLDIAAWSSKSRKAAVAIGGNAWVEIFGSVRRRFWQAPTGIASRWQVEAREIKRIKANS